MLCGRRTLPAERRGCPAAARSRGWASPPGACAAIVFTRIRRIDDVRPDQPSPPPPNPAEAARMRGLPRPLVSWRHGAGHRQERVSARRRSPQAAQRRFAQEAAAGAFSHALGDFSVTCTTGTRSSGTRPSRMRSLQAGGQSGTSHLLTHLIAAPIPGDQLAVGLGEGGLRVGEARPSATESRGTGSATIKRIAIGLAKAWECFLMEGKNLKSLRKARAWRNGFAGLATFRSIGRDRATRPAARRCCCGLRRSTRDVASIGTCSAWPHAAEELLHRPILQRVQAGDATSLPATNSGLGGRGRGQHTSGCQARRLDRDADALKHAWRDESPEAETIARRDRCPAMQPGRRGRCAPAITPARRLCRRAPRGASYLLRQNRIRTH